MLERGNSMSNFRTILFRLIIPVVYFIMFFWTAFSHADDKVYTIYVVPQISAIAIHEAWLPILNKITESTGIKLELKLTAQSIGLFEESLLKEEPDFAFMNPYHFFMVNQKTKAYIPLVRDSNDLRGILVVKKDSLIKSIEDLDKKSVVFPSPNAFAASLLIRGYLEKNGVHISPVYVKTHSNVYRNILMGDADAGGGINFTFEREPEDVRSQLQILYTTPPATPHPIAAHKRVPETIREKFISAFISLAKSPENAKLFDAIQIPHPIAAGLDDYKNLESLKLDKLASHDTE